MEPLTMIALGAGALYLATKSKSGPNVKPSAPLTPVKGATTKRDWLTRIISVDGPGDETTKRTVQVFAPAGSYGPHNQVLVAVYEQIGSDKTNRKVVSLGPQALPQMVTDAGLDFGIKKA